MTAVSSIVGLKLDAPEDGSSVSISINDQKTTKRWVSSTGP